MDLTCSEIPTTLYEIFMHYTHIEEIMTVVTTTAQLEMGYAWKKMNTENLG